MTKGKAKRILAWVTVLVITVSGMFSLPAIAELEEQAPAWEAVSSEASSVATEEKEPVPAPTAVPTAPPTATPTATLSPTVTPEPTLALTPAPTEALATPLPDPTDEITPEPEPEQTPQPTSVPGDAIVSDEPIAPTPQPSETLEAVLDTTLAPTPIPEAEESGFALLPKSGKYNRLSASSLPILQGGMPIPLIRQGNYQRAVCIANGEYKSVATSGCGAASASMLIAYIQQNYDQTPYTLFYWAASKGQYRGSGLAFETVRQMLSNYGVHSKMKQVSVEGIVSALREDHPVIMLMGPGTFTDNGHYIVLRGLDENGMVLVNDPASSSRSKEAYAPELIAREAKGGVMLVASAEKRESAPEVVEEKEARETSVPAKIENSPTIAPVQETPAPTANIDGAYMAQVSVDCVNLRTEIGKGGKIAAQLTRGEQLQVVDEKTLPSGNVWCKVIYQKQELYVRGDMLEKIG